MIRIISNDDRVLEFSVEQALHIPFVYDVYDNLMKAPTPAELPMYFATEAQLLILQRVLTAKIQSNGSFIPSFGGFKIGDCVVSQPPFMRLHWDECLDTIFHSLQESQIEALLELAQATCMWELRTGLLYLMIHRLLKRRNTFERFFVMDPYGLKRILMETYKSALTNVDHNDCCAHPGNSD
jgi:hypothetical protein